MIELRQARGGWLGAALLLALLVMGAVLVLLPLVVVVLTSLAPSSTIPSTFAALRQPTLANYIEAWHRGRFLLAFANSTLVAGAVMVIQVFTSALAGYALARMRFRGRQALLLMIIVALVVPFQVLVVPIFLVLKWGGLINTYGALILPTAASGFGIFLIRQYISTLPPELEEAAALDGATRWQIVWQVLLPLARPALVTVSLFAFIGEWNDLFKPLIFATRPELKTVQIALADFQEQFTNNWPLLMAAATIAILPIALLFSIVQQQFVRGIGTTGLKN
ncbi:ABC-type sugar transport system, permease component [Rubidibacter lacunae KORDI 51-2]|uniref:ABC-type sugar transport system, permease component n=1 Tax=Rubidibacter lacunae KORDI 51-2 TaxID=582515 RepID=U5D5N0_9CHRO|nr:carbohydrate ABC transporter permease [Rubidibacter lacunae]ERN39978.1 ABC-type sugar transport system, permease component [Rubidibacter lacunae KORDI 51-2]